MHVDMVDIVTIVRFVIFSLLQFSLFETYNEAVYFWLEQAVHSLSS
jgi:hypothetical protein